MNYIYINCSIKGIPYSLRLKNQLGMTRILEVSDTAVVYTYDENDNIKVLNLKSRGYNTDITDHVPDFLEKIGFKY